MRMLVAGSLLGGICVAAAQGPSSPAVSGSAGAVVNVVGMPADDAVKAVLSGLNAHEARVSVDGLLPEDVGKAVAALKGSFVRPEALSDPEMARATLQGLLYRLAPEVTLVSGTAPADGGSPFYSEIYQGRTGYLRLGALNKENAGKAAAALADWSQIGLGAAVLDLRGTPASSDFELGSTVAGYFCAKGTELFSLESANAKGAQAETCVAAAPLLFKGLLVVLVDAETAEAAEAVAASLRTCAKALVVGDQTAGRAFEYRDFPLGSALLRVAVAQVILPDGKKPGEYGLKPDINVALGGAPKEAVMRSITAKGIESMIEEHDRPHLNEAALVARSNPEVDELEAEAGGKKPVADLIDRQLQRALDLVTSISVYQGKGSGTAGAGE